MKLVSRRPLIVLLAIAFALRLAAGWAWQSQMEGRFGMGDSDSYWRLGLAIAQGQPYEIGQDHFRVFRSPGYPILLAPILGIAGDGPAAVMWARAEAALLGTLAVLGVWWLTRLLFDDRAALLAAALAAIYPGAIALSVLILSEAPFCPLMLLQLVLWILAWQASSPGKRALFGIGAGFAGGAATLMRPSWLLFTPLAIAVEMLMKSKNKCLAAAGTAARGEAGWTCCRPLNESGSAFLNVNKCHEFVLSCWILLGLATAMTPWWIRNACVTGHFVPTTLQTGASLYDGQNPEANGSSNMEFGDRIEEEERWRFKKSPGDEMESLEMRLDRRLRSESLAWMRSNPGRSAELAGIKFLRMWNVWPNEPRFSSWPLRLAVFFTYTPLLIFAIIGAWRTIGRGWPYILCWLPAVYLTALHVVFVSSIRYREPAMLALLALAAGAMLGSKGQGLGAKDWGLGIRMLVLRKRRK
jgi:hypothetical protein